MKNDSVVRLHGGSPYTVVLVHGGPGAAGEMTPVARELSSRIGVLEPLQTAVSVDGQIEELRSAILAHCELPCTLVGFSWGAWLGCLLAGRYPSLVEKLILVGSAPFEKQYADGIDEIRMNRLTAGEREEVGMLLSLLKKSSSEKRFEAFLRFGVLFSKADAYDPTNETPDDDHAIVFDPDIFMSVWPEAAELRADGALLDGVRRISCPVVAIHGDYDSHSPEGVEKPLSQELRDFRFILLKQCGHKPWIERQARDEFYRVLLREMEK